MGYRAIIIGDSYSTFKGYVPQGYDIYYSEVENAGTGVTDVTQTWWHMLAKEAGLELIQNNSWSGSTIGYTGYNNIDCSRSSSFIYRFQKLTEEGFFQQNQVDKVFLFGGTNDSWSDAPLGQAKFSNWSREDLYFVLPAICYFLHLVKTTLPAAQVYCLINTQIKPGIQDCMKQACDAYGITPVTFEYIDKQSGHPTIQGMADIKNGVLAVLQTC